MAINPEQYGSGTTPAKGDTKRMLLVKLNLGGGGGGGSGLAGTGSPQGVVSASPGTTYLDTSANGFWAKASGSGNVGWVNLIA